MAALAYMANVLKNIKVDWTAVQMPGLLGSHRRSASVQLSVDFGNAEPVEPQPPHHVGRIHNWLIADAAI